MHNDVTFLQDLAVVMIVAGIVTVLFHRLRQPVVLGYILAGFIIGPHTPPFPLVQDERTIRTLADLGVVLLMFSLGLEFSLRKLRAVGVTAFIGASLEILLMVWVGYEVGRLFGWRVMDSIFLGAMLSISSTTIIVRALAELGKTKAKFAQLIFGILIVEDILAIVMIALLSGIAMTGSLRAGDVAITVGKLGLFLVVSLLVGFLVVPHLLSFVAKSKRNEILLVTVLGLCFGVSLLAVKLGYSVALGAFMIGAVIAEAREIGKIELLTEPIRDMFSAVFFVAIGMMINPKLLLQYAPAIVVITLAVVLGKVISCSLGAFVAGNDTRTSLRVGMGLAQIGEFSFIIASLGLTLKVTSEFLYPIAVAVSAITTLLTPYLIKSSDRLVNWFDRTAPRSLLAYLELYTQWAGRLAQPRSSSMARRFVRRWLWQLLLNVILIAAIFVCVAFVAQTQPSWLAKVPLGQRGLKALFWLSATTLSLPLFIASFRKLQALGMLIAELKVTRAAAGENTQAIRVIVSQTIPIVGMIGLSLFVLILSSTLLPPLNVLIVLLLVIALLTWLLWRSSIKIYSKAQAALHQVLSQPPAPRHEESARALPAILKEAILRTVPISPTSPAARKLIRELQLRTSTGASIAGIERDGANIINPGPDEELLPGDQLLLLGSATQLEAAQAVLAGS